jgi:uncharacterized protein YqgC (DUF456 family)
MLYIIYSISVILILAGLVGIFLPVVPGIPVVLAGMLLAGLTGHFISTGGIIVLVALTLVSVLMDLFSGALGAKYSGAGILSMAGAILGAILGFSLLGFVGMFIGPALGVLIFELLTKRSIKKSTRSAGYTLIATTVGILINVLIAISMLAIFIFAIFL